MLPSLHGLPGFFIVIAATARAVEELRGCSSVARRRRCLHSDSFFLSCLALAILLFEIRTIAHETGETPKKHKSESATGGATTSATAEVSQLYKNARRCRPVAATASSEPESELGHSTHVVLDIIGMAQFMWSFLPLVRNALSSPPSSIGLKFLALPDTSEEWGRLRFA